MGNDHPAMRNIYQPLIDACRGDKSRLTRLHTSAAELLRSSYDALLQAPEGSEERSHQEWLQRQIKDALAQIDKLCGWS